MNDVIRVKMARAEGLPTSNIEHATREEAERVTVEAYSMPSYDNDNDLDRFIRAMGRRHLIKYRVALYHVTKPTGQQVADSTELRMIVATVDQKQAAVIKAMGWEGVAE